MTARTGIRVQNLHEDRHSPEPRFEFVLSLEPKQLKYCSRVP
jgi:hypothetical protein